MKSSTDYNLKDGYEWALEVILGESSFRKVIEVLKKHVCDFFCDCGSCPLHIPEDDTRCIRTDFEEAVDLAKKDGLKQWEFS